MFFADLFIYINSDLAKVWINVDVGIFENPIVMQKQASVKTMKISTYLKDKINGITGNNIYTLCTLPEAYRPATTVIINLPCGRYAGGTTSIPDFAYVQINTAGTVVMSPFDNITNHAINMHIAYF